MYQLANIKWQIYSVPIVILLLSGCAAVPVAPQSAQTPVNFQQQAVKLKQLRAWDARGAIAVKQAHNGWHAAFVWLQRGDYFEIGLEGPLGSGSVQLVGKPGAITMTSQKGEQRASSPEALLQQQTGWRLPVSDLRYWLRGIPVPGKRFYPEFDHFNHLTQLAQEGWNIVYDRYTTNKSFVLPRRITLTTADLTIRIVINSWKLS